MKRLTLIAAVGAVVLAYGCSKEQGKPHGGGEPAATAPEKGAEHAGNGSAKAHDETGNSEEDHDKEGHAEEGHDEEGHGEEGHEERIKLAPKALKAARLEYSEVLRRSLSVGLKVPGRVSLTQNGVAKVTARVPGRVAKLKVMTGQKVAAGQVLATVESQDLGQIRADFIAAATRVRVAKANYDREQELFKKGITSEKEMREAEGAHAEAQASHDAADARLHALGLSEAEITSLKGNEHFSASFPARAPIAGTVIAVGAVAGQSVDGTTELMTVANLSELWVMLDVSESQLTSVRRGQVVEVTLQAAPGERLRGRLDYVGDIVDEKTRTVPVRVVVPNPSGQLKPGMFVTAEIATGGLAKSGANRLLVPRAAVQQVGKERVVFVPAEPGEFRVVEVEVGEESIEDAEILGGLDAGQRVVTTGAFILKSELSKESMGEGHSH